MESKTTFTERLVRTLSKMFLVLVMQFSNPPVVSIWDRDRGSRVALVMPLRRRTTERWPDTEVRKAAQAPHALLLPPSWQLPADEPDLDTRTYIPVQAA